MSDEPGTKTPDTQPYTRTDPSGEASSQGPVSVGLGAAPGSMIGRQIGGFKILARLGGGGFGVVYKAHDVALNRFVALKFLLETVDPKDLGRFAEEARKLARLGKHPNIIQVYGSGKYEGRDYIILEYADYSAADLIEQSPGGLSIQVALRIAAECAQALAYTHREGIIHRDIKPQNILIDKASGRAQIADFGIACFYESEIATQSSTRLGTPHYVSPEQIAGRRVDQRSDVFSLGATLHELLCWQKLFPGHTQYELLDNIKNGRRNSLRRIKPELPRSVVDLVKKATNHHPSRRYQSADEFAAAILEVLKEIEAGEPKPVRRLSRRTLKWITLGAACLFLICITVSYTLVPSRSRPSATEVPTRNGREEKSRLREFPKPPIPPGELSASQSACDQARKNADVVQSAQWAKESYEKAREAEKNARESQQNDLQTAIAKFGEAARLYEEARKEAIQEGEKIAGVSKEAAEEERGKAEGLARYDEADWKEAETNRNDAVNVSNRGDFVEAKNKYSLAQAAYARVIETAQQAAIEELESKAREIRAVAENAEAPQYAKDLYDEAGSLQGVAATARTAREYARARENLQRANDKYSEAAQVAFRKQAEAAETDALSARNKADIDEVKNHPPNLRAWNEAEALMRSGRELLKTLSEQVTTGSATLDPVREVVASVKDKFQEAAMKYREAATRFHPPVPPTQPTDREGSMGKPTVGSTTPTPPLPTDRGASVEKPEQPPRKPEAKIGKDYEALFQGILKDKDPDTRERSIQAYVQDGSAGVSVLVKHLASSVQKERDLAKGMIDRCGEQATEELLKAIKTSKENPTWQTSRAQVAEILAKRRDPRVKETLTTVLANLNEDVRVRAACAEGLSQFKEDDCVGALITALRDQDDQVQEKAAVALGRVEDRRAVGPLIDLLRTSTENPSVRAKAAEALGRIGDPRAKQALTGATRDTDPVLVQEALAALGKLAGS